MPGSNQMNKVDLLSFNWLALKANNDSLLKSLGYIKGIVVDLGCGTAPYRQDILRVADRYIGIDWPNSQHDQVCVDVFADLTSNLPFNDDFADTIVSFQVMEHLPEPSLFLAECNRILKPGGRLVVTVPFMWHIHEAPHDYYRYTRYGLKYLLAKNRFVDINIVESTGFWQMMALKFNYQTNRYAKGPFRYLFIPIWWATQIISPLLDKYDYNPRETGSYTVVARKCFSSIE
jgi:SAM-dependent methyltransferase